jgi:hypothetical protein
MIQLTWENSENKLLIWQFDQRWSRADFLNACQKSQHMIETAGHPVNMLMDLSESQFYPSNLIYMGLVWMRSHAGKTDKVVVISPSRLWDRIYRHIFGIYSMDFLPVEFVSSCDEAMTILQAPSHTK